jgi:hypothetical protein
MEQTLTVLSHHIVAVDTAKNHFVERERRKPIAHDHMWNELIHRVTLLLL